MKYIAIINAGWKHSTQKPAYHLLEIKFNSIKINKAHGPPFILDPNIILPAKWNMWINAGTEWFKVNGLDELRDGQTISIDKTMNVLVKDTDKLPIQTTGWVSREMDDPENMFVRTQMPSDLGFLGDYLLGDFGDSIEKANIPSGVIRHFISLDGLSTSTEEFVSPFGVGVHNDESRPPDLAERDEPIVLPTNQQDLDRDFTLNYEIRDITPLR